MGIVQGIEPAIKKFEKRGTNFFALYCGSDKFPLVNNLNGRYEDISECVEELKDYFEDITPDHKKIYTIHSYENAVKPDAKGKICEYPIYSVKFVTSNPEQIQEYYNGYAQRQQNYVGNSNNAILSKLEAIEQKIAIDQEEEEEEIKQEPQGFSGIISGIVNNPDVQVMLANIFMGALDRFMPLKKETVAINGFDDNKLDEALIILKKHDPELESDLMLLAKMAESNPGQFKFLLSMLRK